MSRVTKHPRCRMAEPPLDTTEALLERAHALPDSLVVVLGAQPPSRPGNDFVAVHMCRDLAPCELQGLDDEWQGNDGLGGAQHVVWLSDSILVHAEHAPEYYAFLLGHEFEHARTAGADLGTAALEQLVEVVTLPRHVPFYRDLPHERHCDIAGLWFTRDLFGQGPVYACFERLGAVDRLDPKRQRWFRHLQELLLEGNTRGDVRAAIVAFVVEHGLKAALLGLWDCPCYKPFTDRIDRAGLERELEAARR